MAYENRLLLFVDILGWKDAIRDKDREPELRKAVEKIHERALVNNQAYREELIRQSGDRVNPLFLQVQFGAFSDHFVLSLPEGFGWRIASSASNLIVDLLRKGWLTRGAIVLGPLHHQDNIVFGPALLEAVDLEKATCFPRIQVSPSAVTHLSEFPSDPRDQRVIKDHQGVSVVNPFTLGMTTDNKELMDRFIRENRGLAEIKAHVERQIDRYTGHDDKRGAKWTYMRDFIGGPVLNAVPELKDHWK